MQNPFFPIVFLTLPKNNYIRHTEVLARWNLPETFIYIKKHVYTCLLFIWASGVSPFALFFVFFLFSLPRLPLSFFTSTANDAHMTHGSLLGQNNLGQCTVRLASTRSTGKDFAHSWKHKQYLTNQTEFDEDSKYSSYSSWKETQENFLPSELLVPGGFLLKHRLGLLLFLEVKRHEIVCADPTACCQQRKEELLLASPIPSQPSAPTACWTTREGWPYQPSTKLPQLKRWAGLVPKKGLMSSRGGAREGPVALHRAGLKPKGVKPPGTSKPLGWSNMSRVNPRSDTTVLIAATKHKVTSSQTLYFGRRYISPHYIATSCSLYSRWPRGLQNSLKSMWSSTRVNSPAPVQPGS